MKVEGNLRALGLPSGTFDAVVVGEDIILKKPAPISSWRQAAGLVGSQAPAW